MPTITTSNSEERMLSDGIAEALLHRLDPSAPLSGNGRRFRGMTLLEMGRTHMAARGFNCDGMGRVELAGALLTHRSGGPMGTSDFSNLLANVAKKRLRAAYAENPGTYRRWARRAPDLPDFKPASVVQLSAMPDLLQVNEAGEFTYGSMSDGASSYSLITYGRIVGFTRQAMVNDDLRAFDRMVAGFGAAAMRLENRLVYAQITGNPAMSDGVALFHASHGNLGTGAGSALQTSALTAGRTAMRTQKGLAAEELNIVPATLIVPAALEQTAYQLTSPAMQATTPDKINEFRQGGRTSVEPVIEPILDANSATAWYFAGANSQVDTVEYCWLEGADGPTIESQIDFASDGLQLKARLDFACKALDFRGLYKGAGS